MGHIHYDATQCTTEQFVTILKEAHAVCKRWWFDKLDNSVRRERVEGITFEDSLAYFTKDARPVVIERRGDHLDEPYSEIGFHTIASPSFFLWVINDAGYAHSLGLPLQSPSISSSLPADPHNNN